MKPRNYQCRKCGKINQITTPWGMIFTPHMGWHKWVKCDCGARRHFQRRVFQPEMNVRKELEDALRMVSKAVDMGRVEVEKREKLLDEAYSMIDNLRDDICELKAEKTEAETAKKIFADMDKATSTRECDISDEYNEWFVVERWLPDTIYSSIKKKYGVEE